MFLNLSTHAEYYTVQSISQDVVNPDGVSPSVVVLVALNLKVYTFRLLEDTVIYRKLMMFHVSTACN